MKAIISIGLNYRGTEYPLKGCENDANFYIEKATKAGFKIRERAGDIDAKYLRARLSYYAQLMTRKNDLFVFCFSGHGTKVGENEAMVLRGNGKWSLYSDIDIFRSISEFTCKVVCIMDCCFSGGLAKSAQFTDVLNYRRKYIPFQFLNIAPPGYPYILCALQNNQPHIDGRLRSK